MKPLREVVSFRFQRDGDIVQAFGDGLKTVFTRQEFAAWIHRVMRDEVRIARPGGVAAAEWQEVVVRLEVPRG